MPFAKLDPARIRGEALRLFRAAGLAGVGMRRLAASLGVSPSSLYWHVPDQQTLHGMLAEDIFRACLDDVPDASGWDEWLRAFGLALRDAQKTMPDTHLLILSTAMSADARTALRAHVVRQLELRGLPAALAVGAQHSVQALVTGWTSLGFEAGAECEPGEVSFLVALDVLLDGWRARSLAPTEDPAAES